MQYEADKSEKRAQEFWQTNASFKAIEEQNANKFYCLSMLPYPSGKLHMGHVRNYTIGDVIARQKRMLGMNVLQPIGWDAFGLPAENAAIKNNNHPASWTYENIKTMRKQLQQLGMAFDWSRELATCDADYYHWEQWLFLQLYKKGLAYRKDSIVNWDPVDQTVLANEQVVDGRGWRSGALVEKKQIPQWFFKITAYADELLDSLDELTGWPEQVKTMQRNWIGRSTGLEIEFELNNSQDKLTVFTTRADTLYGVTYLAIAADHPLLQNIAKQSSEMTDFIQACQKASTMESEIATTEKLGIDTGLTAIHPLTGDEIPIWAANFVLMEYGSGVVMSVPAHDQRDFEFAKKYDLPIQQVINNDKVAINLNKAAFSEYGTLINSDTFSGLDSMSAKAEIAKKLTIEKHAREKTHYRLRDWGVSRQRYWGAPIPIIYCNDCGTVPVPEQDLPVKLPDDIKLTGEGSALKSCAKFYQVDCPKCGKAAKRETDTFDTFVESSWYYLRYACPDQNTAMLDERAQYWEAVDQYVGGIEHAVMHLLYARFFHKVMRDHGLIKTNEPFIKLLTQGMVLKDGQKMSKSKGNVVDPHDLIKQFGADTVRLFSIFAAPPEQSLEWSASGVEGAYRFIRKLWQHAYNYRDDIIKLSSKLDFSNLDAEDKNLRYEIHKQLQQIEVDIQKQKFNTIVSAGMKMLNALMKVSSNQHIVNLQAEGLSILIRVLSPIIPHVCHVLWQELEFGTDISKASWPIVDKTALATAAVKLVVQINGKRKAEISVAPGQAEEEVKQIVLNDNKVKTIMADKSLRKFIYVPNRLVNLVIG